MLGDAADQAAANEDGSIDWGHAGIGGAIAAAFVLIWEYTVAPIIEGSLLRIGVRIWGGGYKGVGGAG